MTNRITLLAICAALHAYNISSPILAQSAFAPPSVFDRVTIYSIALFLEAPSWSKTLTHKPSKGFTDLLLTRPQFLLFAGKWFVSAADSIDSTAPVEVDLTKYPLLPSDLDVAKEILRVEYIKRFVICLQEALVGKGKVNCLKTLFDAAEKAGEEIKDPTLSKYLEADLGARLLALSSNNPEWKVALTSGDMPEVDLVIKANAALESRKAVAVSSGVPIIVKGVAPVSFKVVYVGEDVTDWVDFVSAFLAQEKSNGKLRLSTYGWRVANGEAVLTSLDDKPDVYTISIDNTRRVMIKGSLTDDDFVAINLCKSWNELIGTIGEKKWTAYLSRAGSGTLGKLDFAQAQRK